jgi:hypothetical protein
MKKEQTRTAFGLETGFQDMERESVNILDVPGPDSGRQRKGRKVRGIGPHEDIPIDTIADVPGRVN